MCCLCSLLFIFCVEDDGGLCFLCVCVCEKEKWLEIARIKIRVRGERNCGVEKNSALKKIKPSSTCHATISDAPSIPRVILLFLPCLWISTLYRISSMMNHSGERIFVALEV